MTASRRSVEDLAGTTSRFSSSHKCLAFSKSMPCFSALSWLFLWSYSNSTKGEYLYRKGCQSDPFWVGTFCKNFRILATNSSQAQRDRQSQSLPHRHPPKSGCFSIEVPKTTSARFARMTPRYGDAQRGSIGILPMASEHHRQDADATFLRSPNNALMRLRSRHPTAARSAIAAA